MILSSSALRSTDVEIWKAQWSSTSPHLQSSLALDSAHVEMWNSIEFSLMCQTDTMLGPPGSKIQDCSKNVLDPLQGPRPQILKI